MTKRFWTMENRAEEVFVDLLGIIGEGMDGEESVSAAQFIRELRAVKGGKRLVLTIHSAGGSVWDAIGIFEALRAYPGEKVARVPALAASAATIVMVAADTIQVGDRATIMIHDPHTIGIGGAEDFEATARRLRRGKEQIVAIYHKRTGIPTEKLSKWMSDETWWTRGRDAIADGFADEVLNEHKSRSYQIAACAPELLRHYKHVPKCLKRGKPAPVSADVRERLKRLGIQ